MHDRLPEYYEIQGELSSEPIWSGVVVLKVRDLRLGQLCALKTSAREPNSIQRRYLLREARVLASVEHPNVVELREALAPSPVSLVMEYVEGGDLGAKLDGMPWQPVRAALLVEQLAR